MITRISDGAWDLIDRARVLGREIGALPLLALIVAVLAAVGGAVWLFGGDDGSDRASAPLSGSESPRLEQQAPAASDRTRRERSHTDAEPREPRASGSATQPEAAVPSESVETRATDDGEQQDGEQQDGEQQDEAAGLLGAGLGGNYEDAGGGDVSSDGPQLLEGDLEGGQQPAGEPQSGLLGQGG